MGGYITVDKDLPRDPRLGKAARALQQGVTRDCHARHILLGVTVELWAYADTHIRQDNVLPCDLVTLADVLGTTPEILRALPAGWLLEREDGSLELPDYAEKNGVESKDTRREQARERKRRQRERERAAQAAGGGVSEPAQPVTLSRVTGVTVTPPPIPIPTPIKNGRVIALGKRADDPDAIAAHKAAQREELGRLEVEYAKAGFRTALAHETARSYRTAYDLWRQKHRPGSNGAAHAPGGTP